MRSKLSPGLLAALAVVGLACADGEAGRTDHTDGGPHPDGEAVSEAVAEGLADAEAGTDSGPGPDGEDGVGPDGDAGMDGARDAWPDMPTPTFLVGYNEAWFNTGYGTDLTTNFDVAVVTRTFDGILAAGGHIVRLWLFEFLEGLVLGPGVPQLRGIDPTLLDNLELVLDEARARGLWIYLTALEGNEMQTIPERRDFYWNLLNNVYGEGDAYNELVLAPLLERLDAHRDVVWGFDLMNEIEAPRSVSLWSDPIGGPRAWIQRTTAFVKSRAPWLRVTSTAGWSTSQWDIASGLFSGLGLDFYDLHVYSDSGSYDGATAVCDRAAADGVPVVLGEFGQSSEERIDDTLQYDVTGAFLYTARSLCFTAALAWRYDFGPSCWDFVRADGSYRPAVSVMQLYGALP